MNYTEYITIGGERWDNIAGKSYANDLEIATIREANPDVPSYAVFPAGVSLLIPIIEEVPSSVDTNKIPFWKR